VSSLNCDELVELVTEFLDGALESDTEQQILDHLAQCDGCQAHLDQMQATIRALGEVPAGRLPEDTRATLLEAFRRASD
jgi:anti-sigma factor RsiW